MSTGSERLLFVCLNPAWQRSLVFDRVVLGEVNRARSAGEAGGGKGVNAARAARLLGAEVGVALFAGGGTGDLLRAELEKAGIHRIDVSVEQPTRTCTTLVDAHNGLVTEMIEPSGRVAEARSETLKERILSEMTGFAALAICGSSPPGVPRTFYGDLVHAARSRGLTVLLDGVSGIGPALAAGVDILKLNAQELCDVTGETELSSALRHPMLTAGARWIAITDGPREAWLAGAGERIRFTLPRLEGVRNSIGAGDCAAAVMLVHCGGRKLTATSVRDAFTAALGAASASCLTDVPAHFRPRTAEVLRSRITWVRDKTSE